MALAGLGLWSPKQKTTRYVCNSKIKVDTWKTTMYLPFSYAKI